jgi:DNA-binding phage protein
MTQTANTREIQQALAQGLRQHREVVRALLGEVLEDAAAAHAIKQRRKTKRVKRASAKKRPARRR